MKHAHNMSPAFHRRRHGQAIIEFALIVSLIVLLLAAAVDLGNAYRTYQTLVNASAEASSYLAHNPTVNCVSQPCPGGTPESGADREARIRFRTEQGATVRATASTLDLDNNGVDDISEHGWSFVEQRVRIRIADGSSVDSTNPNTIPGNYAGTSDSLCRQRKRFDSRNKPCFVVVQSETIYRPMILSTILGREMTVRATSVKPIVGGE